jgi:hypothetical protein
MLENVEKKKIKIEIPEHYKRNLDESVWDELEEILFSGFLTVRARVSGIDFIFKTLNIHESNLINFSKPSKESPLEQKTNFQAKFIAYSTFMIDGENALHDRPNHIRNLIELIKKIPMNLQNEVLNKLGDLNRKASRLYPLVEVFVHENRSKLRWYQLNNSQIHLPESTGIPGTNHLGMNSCQSTWTSINRLIEIRDQTERDWTNAKFVGSCFNGKGVRSIDQQDKQHKDIELQKVEQLKVEVLYKYLNKLDENAQVEKQTMLPDGRLADVEKTFKAETVQDLADQLSKSLSDEKDFHDLVVEQTMNRIKQRRESIDKYHRSVSSGIIVNREGGSRILGGREEADQILNRIRGAKNKAIEENYKYVRPDMEDDT